MIPTELADRRDRLLGPKSIAEICSGRVLRLGDRGAAPVGRSGDRRVGRIVTDSRQLQEGDCFVALPGDAYDGHEFLGQVFELGAAGAVVCRPISKELLDAGGFVVRVDDTLQALLEMARAYRLQHTATVIGITGSCGKTSTKDMLGRVLAAAMPTVWSPKSFNNSIGVPLTLFQIRPDTEAAVVEIGSNAPGEIEQLAAVANPDIGIVTRIDESHLMRLGSLEGVAREKSSLVAGLNSQGVAILNGDDQSTPMMRASTEARVVEVKIDSEADWFATDVSFHGLGTSFRLMGEHPVTLPRLGSHNVYNALFSIAAARELEVPLDTILAELCKVPPTARRLECKRLGDVSVIDDTYNSNPASAKAALLALSGLSTPGRRLAVFGEMLELGDRAEDLHRQLGVDVAAAPVDLLITVGDGARPIAEAAVEAGMSASLVRHAADVEDSVELLQGELRPGDWLLCKASRGVGLDRLVDDLAVVIGK